MSAGEQLSAGNLTKDAEATQESVVEQHHVDIIPENARHGRPRDQFTLWFAANANVVNFTLGVLAILFGLNLFWALVAIVVGNVLGMLLTALHAWQGPRLGVPQMIQSRGQFGFYGASFILLASIVLDIGYLAASQVLQGDSLNLLVSSISVPVWIFIITLPALALAIFGYRWIHSVQKVMTAVFAVVIVIAVIQADLRRERHIDHAVRGARRLDRHAGAHRHGQPAGGAGQGVRAVDHVLHGDQPDSRGHAQRLQRHAGVCQPGQLQQEVHGRAIQAGRPAHRHRHHLPGRHDPGHTRLQESFLQSFENFIGVLLFFFVQWSAINLVDYYLVKRGRYDVASFFTPNGIYGRIQWWACLCYVITLAVQVPFLDQTFYTGPFVKPLGGADISWIVGFALASLLYLAGARRFAGVRWGLPATGPVGSAS